MAKTRFRDIKQGRVEKIKPKKENRDSLNIINKSTYFKAFLTDSFMLLMPIMYIVFYLVFGSREGFAQHMGLGWIYILGSLTIIEVLFLYFKGQTPGMKAYDVKLISYSSGKKPSIIQIVIRQIFSKVTFLLFLWLIILFMKRVRTPQDFIANTALVYTK